MRFPLPALLVPLVLSTGMTLPARTAAQDSAPSSHMVFDDDFPGDILIHEVRVPASGEALYTYYEALGWRGTGAGYAGIQAHPKAHLFIFSIWDHPQHAAPIRAVFRGPGTETVGFGGEGTGLKSWNFELGWSTDVWYTLVARAWPVDDHTYFGFWSRDGASGKWTHLVTMDVAAEARFEGRTDAFIEDWLSTGARARTTHLRAGWKRRLDGTWFPFGSARYSVNAWDLEPGKRSYHFRSNWNGGVDRDEKGAFYFMTSGGANTKPTTTNPSVFSIQRQETEPAYPKLELRGLRAELNDERTRLLVNWEVDETTTPPFSYQLAVFDKQEGRDNQERGEALHLVGSTEPHARSASIDLSPLKSLKGNLFLRLECSDVLGRQANPLIVPLPPIRN